ncbi:PH domain-containing protein [Streptomyces tanashiensis]|uniref:PH domain-containing protein n=1 Tax=Streptomyces tanashiensis TaxID=67367 RepID=A0ABY6R3G6_9ACTN|nr:PH domain-containing protein [Streptomyces tanashiensis]UZX24611.1 PH domain-containing protein [Streptomyces tanashiensis]GGY14312.1 membrane protein [Streptomyces tanashiensis]
MTGENAVRLRPPRNAVDERAVTWWRVQLLVTTAIPVVVLGVLGALIGPARFWLLLAAGAVAVLGLACTAFFPAWWFRVHRWEVTDEAVYVRTGALWQEWRIAPMSRIQTVDTVRGPLEQTFRLATVTVTTASSKGPIRIEGLDHALAAELAERLTALTRATPGDAT